MSDERVYTFFHEDGPFQLTETQLVNDYMQLRFGTATVSAADEESGLSATHRWKAPGVWLPKKTTRRCRHTELIGPVLHQCELADGHEGDHRDAGGLPIYPPPTASAGFWDYDEEVIY